MRDDSTPGRHESTDRSDARTHQFRHDPQEQSITVSIIRAVATVSAVDPLSLEPRLYDVVEPDALETLLAADPTSDDVRVSFPFGSYTVTVTGGGEIVVRDDTSVH